MSLERNFNFVSRVEDRLRMKNDQGDAAQSLPDTSTILASFIREIGGAEPTEAEPISSITGKLDDAMVLAAISGKFNPRELTSPAGMHFTNEVLNALSAYCLIEAKEKVEWVLSALARQNVLRGLLSAGTLGYYTNRQLPATDTFGILLRRLLTEKNNFSVSSLSQEELLALSAVLETLKGVGLPGPSLESIKNLMDVRSFLDEYQQLTGDFVGRTEELSLLKIFLELSNFKKWDALELSGMGGSGKSTLLAKFSAGVIASKAATLIILDFDRPGIDPADDSWLATEMARQIGIQYPDYKQMLKVQRQETANLRDDYQYSSGHTFESQESQKLSGWLLRVIANILITDHPSRPMLIILDTIEDVLQQSALPKLLSWINFVADLLSPIPVKIILSGRLYDDLQTDHTVQKLPLNEFDKETAFLFLTQLQVRKTTARKLVQSSDFPLRPLELKLLSKIIREKDIGFEALMEEIKGNKNGNSSEMVLGLIYRRVLYRIKNVAVRKIAYPGLILRFVNPEIITEVLQPLLEMHLSDMSEATRISDALASYAWLAYREPGGDVYHRKDIRRSMISYMIIEDPKLVHQLRHAAIRYFTAIGTEKAAAEILYHQLMETSSVEDTDHFDLEELKSAADYIMSDVADLPKGAAALLSYAASGKISAKDVCLLGPKHFAKAYDTLGRSLVSQQQFRAAYDLYLKGQEQKIIKEPAGDGLLDKWEQEMLFCLGEFQEIRRLDDYRYPIRGHSPILWLLNYIYPRAIIEPETVDQVQLEDALIMVSADKSLGRILSGPDNITIISRLAYSLTLLNYHTPLIASVREKIAEISHAIEFEYKPGHVERSLMLLQCLGGGTIPAEFRLGPSSLKFDDFWLANLDKYTEQDSQRLVIQTIRVFNVETGKPVKARLLLSQIDGSRSQRVEWQNTFLKLSGLDIEVVISLVRGPDTLFRYPCKSAVSELIKNGEDTFSLRGLINDFISFHVEELSNEKFSRRTLSQTDLLDAIIEIIDRSWSLGDFIGELHLYYPNYPKLEMLNWIFQRWKAAFSFTLHQNGVQA